MSVCLSYCLPISVLTRHSASRHLGGGERGERSRQITNWGGSCCGLLCHSCNVGVNFRLILSNEKDIVVNIVVLVVVVVVVCV